MSTHRIPKLSRREAWENMYPGENYEKHLDRRMRERNRRHARWLAVAGDGLDGEYEYATKLELAAGERDDLTAGGRRKRKSHRRKHSRHKTHRHKSHRRKTHRRKHSRRKSKTRRR